MKKIIRLVLIAIAGFLFSLGTNAQDRIIHGIVTTFDSLPLIGATVWAQSTKQEVLTDSLGKFSIACDPSDKLKVTAHGFYTERARIMPNTKIAAINLRMKPGEKAREYAIGYGHVADTDKLNALASLNKNDLDFSQYNSIYELIKGRFAGVQVVNGEIIIRGVNSINSSSAALIVVDGVPMDNSALSNIPPTQVKSINVIKDGSAAIYGSRGANGVVLIETKRGGDE